MDIAKAVAGAAKSVTAEEQRVLDQLSALFGVQT
jgi:hypothetical protein